MKNISSLPRPKAILFDLDGTLLDTAPDLAAAINLLRTERCLEPVPFETLRCVASQGSPGLIRAAFGLTSNDPGYQELVNEFLARYRAAMTVKTTLFKGIPELLQSLREQGIKWGIVTNKIAQLTDPLIVKIGLHEAGCVISGDTMPHPKPHPAPVLEAARRLALEPMECWFVGDDLRDIQAGRAAGTATIAAGWGYCTAPLSWNADYLVQTPQEILELI